VRDFGFSVARTGDAIYVCTRPHCIGPWCHEDRDCYCGSPALGASTVGQLIGGGACTIDKLQPTRFDDFGACRLARCNTHVN